MATEGIMKQQLVEPTGKTVITKVEEVSVTERPILQDNIICALPPAPKFDGELKPTKLSKKFVCEYPSVEQNVYRTREPLPFPDNLHDLISWTDAFVDRIASMTQAEENKITTEFARLAQKISRLEIALSTTAVELDKSRDETAAANDKAEKLQHELIAVKAESASRAETIKQVTQLYDAQTLEVARLQQVIADLNTRLDIATTTIQKQHEEFVKADKAAAERFQKEHADHMEDHNALDQAKEALCEEQAKTKALEKDLATVKEQLATAKSHLEAAKKAKKEVDGKNATLHANIGKLTKTNDVLKAENKKLKDDVEDAQHELTEARKIITTLSGEVTAAKERIHALEQEIIELKAAVARVEEEKKRVITEKDAAIAAAEAELLKSKDEVEDLKTAVTGLKTEIENKDSTIDEITKAMLQAQDEKEQAIRERKEAEAVAEAAVRKARKEEETHETEMRGLRRAAKGKVDPAMLEKAQSDLKDAESKLQDADNKLKDAEYKLGDANSRRSEADIKLNELQARLDEVTNRLVPNNGNKRINILTVEYGGKAFTPSANPEVFKSLYEAAEKKGPFTVDNKFFREDPWQGIQKSCSITYQLNGTGAPLHRYAREHGTITFE